MTSERLANVNLDVCAPIPARKTLVLVNNFITSTVQFLIALVQYAIKTSARSVTSEHT